MMTQLDDFDLETAFDLARAAPPQMPQTLAMRVVEDAERLQPRPPLLKRLLAAVGGPAGFSGLVTATIAGFWFGVTPPLERVDPLALFGIVQVSIDEDLTDLMGGDWFSDEG